MLRVWAFLLTLFFTLSLGAEPVGEYAMKATYLFNFSLLVDWPSGSVGEDFNLCLLGYDNIGQAARQLEGKKVNGHRLVVARLSALSAIHKCQLLFISDRDNQRLRGILRELGDEPVLTVSEVRDSPGAMITFYPENDRLVFEVDPQQAKRAGLIVSSKLLQLAKSVH